MKTFTPAPASALSRKNCRTPAAPSTPTTPPSSSVSAAASTPCTGVNTAVPTASSIYTSRLRAITTPSARPPILPVWPPTLRVLPGVEAMAGWVSSWVSVQTPAALSKPGITRQVSGLPATKNSRSMAMSWRQGRGWRSSKLNRVVKKEKLNETVSRIVLDAPLIAKAAKAGQFVVVMPTENAERIPLTIADFDTAAGAISIIFQIVGATTRVLDSLKVGAEIAHLLGPLGTPSQVENFGTVAVIGGGVGIAEIYPLVKALKKAGNEVITIVSLNPLMLDATGMCGICRVTVNGETKLGCVDGPEFDGHQVDFEELTSRLKMYRDVEKRAYDHVCRLLE